MPDCFSKSEVTDFLNFMKLPDGTSVVSDDLMNYLMAYGFFTAPASTKYHGNYEGGARAVAYKSCFDDIPCGCSSLRLIFWFKNADKEAYEKAFDVTHSDCYSKYGLRRTGCACCPFGKDFEVELAAAEKYEPNLYRAAFHVFGKSYEYTRKYREYREQREKESKSENH